VALSPEESARVRPDFAGGGGMILEPVAQGPVFVDVTAVIQQLRLTIEFLGRLPVRIEVSVKTAEIRFCYSLKGVSVAVLLAETHSIDTTTEDNQY
jgi:hypothetical protein